MRNVRKLMLLAVTALAAMAFAATSASAQTLEITNEAGGAHCSAVSLSGTDVNGGCLTHATSEANIELRKHVFGIESHITSCNNEFAGRVSEDATGYIFEQVLSGASCTRQACKPAGEGTPWAASGSEGSFLEGEEFLTTNFCVEPVGGGTDETCEIDVPLDDGTAGNHVQEYGHASEMSSHGITGFRCELTGHWISETGGTHDGDPEQEGVISHIDSLITVTPTSVNFNHTTGTADIVFRNNTGVEITTENAVISGGGSARFEIDSGCSAKMLPNNATCTVKVTRMATVDESQEARIKLSYMIGANTYLSTRSSHLFN
jgi:hypothetical protein